MEKEHVSSLSPLGAMEGNEFLQLLGLNPSQGMDCRLELCTERNFWIAILSMHLLGNIDKNAKTLSFVSLSFQEKGIVTFNSKRNF